MKQYLWWECPECEYSVVLDEEEDTSGGVICPLCAGDSGRDVRMKSRPATPEDKPEGTDDRKPI